MNSKNESNEFIQTSIEFGNVLNIILNRPEKKNALNRQMFMDLIRYLTDANKDPSISMICLTAEGDYFCAGTDFISQMEHTNENLSIDELRVNGRNLLEAFVNAFIDFSKPLIALVNGPCIGIGFTILALFDSVISSDRATFNAPFTKLGLSPEACSSYTFPMLMGSTKASEILLLDKKLSAKEAFACNLVSTILPHENFQVEAWIMVEKFSKLSGASLMAIKTFLKGINDVDLRLVNKKECDFIMKRWESEEFLSAMMRFANKKSKL